MTEESIVDDTINSCSLLSPFNILEVEQINRGWLNLKWKITTDSGVYLLKQYNRQRLKKYKQEDLLHALTIQNRLYEEGFPCARIYTNADGSLLHQSVKGERFLIMDFCEGEMMEPGTLNQDQMYQLGFVTGKMHLQLNEHQQTGQPDFIPPMPTKRLSDWERTWKEAVDVGKLDLLSLIEKQRDVTKSINITDFNLHDTGWAHRDLWVDNLLFSSNRLLAVLDFNRMKYDYPQLDVARAVLSGALSEHELDISLVEAFLTGYQENQQLTAGFLSKALKLLWYLESPWWISPHMEQDSGPPIRFKEEMIWLADHFKELEEIVNGQ